MVSTERIMSYGRLSPEGPLDMILADKKPPISWPDQGSIHLDHLQFRYAEHLPYVLKSITCDIEPCEKVCVCTLSGIANKELGIPYYTSGKFFSHYSRVVWNQ